ncbi:hypothetical protein jhhlp_007279 [Lomentospora prolificans]|uniref:Uncharacterized protein n=1 Tax=Lomentospora prolificans TaxID=41688 RepID=A0A2N3N281_9PEZI|nr:hypothetical protein jhhlp_007279 [Lomentospora prolificans]
MEELNSISGKPYRIPRYNWAHFNPVGSASDCKIAALPLPVLSIPNDTMNITIYAELLLNIRQVSVVVSLPPRRDASTQAEVFAEGTRIGIRHGHSFQDLLLPGKVAFSGRLPITKSVKDSGSLSWKLPVAQSHATSSLLGQDLYPNPPWTSVDLQPGSSVSCRRCNSIFIPAGTIVSWKDLPSENWAEMMEFWHCHKPDIGHDSHHSHDHLTKRGYGASTAISAQATVGFVDLVSFLVSESDTIGLKVGSAHSLSHSLDLPVPYADVQGCKKVAEPAIHASQ